MTWKPLVDGSLARRALDRACAIGDELAFEPRWLASASPDLFTGAAGVALALAYLDDAVPDRGYAAACARWLERAIDGIDETMPMSLAGAAGIGWMAHHLASPVIAAPNT